MCCGRKVSGSIQPLSCVRFIAKAQPQPKTAASLA
jgi:hypothetical protein